MTDKQQQKLLEKQLKEMCKDFTATVLKSIPRALNSGMVSDDLRDGLLCGEYLFAKAILDSKMRDRPYRALGHKADFDNLYLAL